MRWNDSRGVLPSQDRRPPGVLFSPRIELLQWSHFDLGYNNSRGVNLSWDRTTPGESFSHRIERLPGSHSVLG